MPEAPEVETVRRVLLPQLKGRTIASASLVDSKLIAYPEPEAFIAAIQGKSIKTLERQGKFLVLCFTDESLLVIHLRMTGQLFVAPCGFEREKHTRFDALLSDGKILSYVDVRRFGKFWFFEKGKPDTISGIAKLGPEPEAISGDYLLLKAGKKNKAIKEILLDQSIIAGVGNIYSDEILFEAKLCPLKKASRLTAEEWENLAQSVKKIINQAMEDNTITPEHYFVTRGMDYQSSAFLKVYGREGEKCPRCGTALVRTVIGGRSSVYCPSCQKASE